MSVCRSVSVCPSTFRQGFHGAGCTSSPEQNLEDMSVKCDTVCRRLVTLRSPPFPSDNRRQFPRAWCTCITAMLHYDRLSTKYITLSPLIEDISYKHGFNDERVTLVICDRFHSSPPPHPTLPSHQ